MLVPVAVAAQRTHRGRAQHAEDAAEHQVSEFLAAKRCKKQGATAKQAKHAEGRRAGDDRGVLVDADLHHRRLHRDHAARARAKGTS